RGTTWRAAAAAREAAAGAERRQRLRRRAAHARAHAARSRDNAMSFAARQLLELIPTVLRIRDQARAQITPGLLDPADRAVLAARKAAKPPLTDPPLSEIEEHLLTQLQQQSLAGPLASLLAVIAEQIAVLQEDLDQLYDDQFIETCAGWVTPYIGDLLGCGPLHGVTSRIASPRAAVAPTIAYRRPHRTALLLAP